MLHSEMWGGRKGEAANGGGAGREGAERGPTGWEGERRGERRAAGATWAKGKRRQSREVARLPDRLTASAPSPPELARLPSALRAGMEPNSPRKIQFTVPLLEPHLDPEAAEQVGGGGGGARGSRVGEPCLGVGDPAGGLSPGACVVPRLRFFSLDRYSKEALSAS
ncbi:UNVERIFIED_CONTAM: hypothetical protein K2H54_045479 [Gekko kuhli]